MVSAYAMTCTAHGATTVVVRQTADVRASPDGVSRVIAKLPVQTQVEQLSGRYGPWIQVRTEQGLVGWLLSLDIVGVHPTAPPLQAAMRPAVGVQQAAPALPVASLTRTKTKPSPQADGAYQASAETASKAAGQSEPSAASPAAETPPSTATSAIPLADQRLAQLQTYRAESEAARRFAFRAGLELAKVPPSPKEAKP